MGRPTSACFLAHIDSRVRDPSRYDEAADEEAGEPDNWRRPRASILGGQMNFGRERRTSRGLEVLGQCLRTSVNSGGTRASRRTCKNLSSSSQTIGTMYRTSLSSRKPRPGAKIRVAVEWSGISRSLPHLRVETATSVRRYKLSD